MEKLDNHDRRISQLEKEMSDIDRAIESFNNSYDSERIVALENKVADIDLAITILRNGLNQQVAKNHVHEKIGGKTRIPAPSSDELSKKLAEAVGEVNHCNNNRFEDMDKYLHQMQTLLADLTNTWKKIGIK